LEQFLALFDEATTDKQQSKAAEAGYGKAANIQENFHSMAPYGIVAQCCPQAQIQGSRYLPRQG